MSKKTKDDFIQNHKPEKAIIALSIENYFSWAMLDSKGNYYTYHNEDVSFFPTLSFPFQVFQLRKELFMLPKLVGKIEGAILRLPRLRDVHFEASIRRAAAVGFIKTFLDVNDITYRTIEKGDIQEEAFFEAQKIRLGNENGQKPFEPGIQEELYALEALVNSTLGDENDNGASQNQEINIFKGGAV